MISSATTGQDQWARKCYQLIIGRLDGENLSLHSYREKIRELVRKGIGGFIVFGGQKNAVSDFIAEIQSFSRVPLFIASDIERGVGQQIRKCSLFPCQMAVSAAIAKDSPEDVRLLENAIRMVAAEAQSAGINMPLIPVLDVNRDPDNPIICTRAFSDDPADVAWFGLMYIKILEHAGLISCAKHFPGHGDTSVDSHIQLPVIRKTYSQLMETDLVPFRTAIDNRVSSIMVGHLSLPVIDTKPSSLSKKIISEILRKELGFNGLVLTDALTMHALKDIRDVHSQCIDAGADILLHPSDPDSAVKELIASIEAKEITGEQIDSAWNRIFKAKESIKNNSKRDIDYEKQAMLSSKISDLSITLVKNTPGVLPIRESNENKIMFAGDKELFESSLLKGYFKKGLKIDEAKKYKHVIPPHPPLEKGGGGGFSGEMLIFAIFTSVAAWKGSSGISEDEKALIQEMIKKSGHSIVISFGSPYVLRYFQEADVLIAAYDVTEQAQTAVLKCLEGRMDFRGRLPVKIDFNIP